jgi:hypothetical protein
MDYHIEVVKLRGGVKFLTVVLPFVEQKMAFGGEKSAAHRQEVRKGRKRPRRDRSECFT